VRIPIARGHSPSPGAAWSCPADEVVTPCYERMMQSLHIASISL
jgi:hypothetical protein